MGYDIDECAVCYLNGCGNNSVGEYQTIYLCLICFGKAVGMRTGGSSMSRSGRLPSEFNQYNILQEVNCYCNRHDDSCQLGFRFPCCDGCRDRTHEEIDEELGPPSPPPSDDLDEDGDDGDRDDGDVEVNNNDEGDDGSDHESDKPVIIPTVEPISEETE